MLTELHRSKNEEEAGKRKDKQQEQEYNNKKKTMRYIIFSKHTQKIDSWLLFYIQIINYCQRVLPPCP